MSMSIAKPLIRQNPVSSFLIESHIAWWGNGLGKNDDKNDDNKNPDVFRHSLRHHYVSLKKPSCPRKIWMCSTSTSPIQVVIVFLGGDLSRKKKKENGGAVLVGKFFGLEAVKWGTEGLNPINTQKRWSREESLILIWFLLLVVVGTSNRNLHKIAFVFLSKNSSDFNIAQRTTLPLMANLYYPRNAGSVKHVKPPTVWTRCCHLTQKQNPKKHRYEYIYIWIWIQLRIKSLEFCLSCELFKDFVLIMSLLKKPKAGFGLDSFVYIGSISRCLPQKSINPKITRCPTKSEPRKKPSYFPLYWLFDKDPYNGLLQSG